MKPELSTGRGPMALHLRRAIALVMCELIILQPAIATAQVLSQVPMFTVTSAPPNVMLTLDDSASMDLLSLDPAPDYAWTGYSVPADASKHWPTSGGAAGRHPLLKVNTFGYFGISGMRHYAGPANGDGRWTFHQDEVRQRSPVFNPLAYNPAVRYRPWNENGAPFPPANFGGSSGSAQAAVGQRTEWDMRRLPASMGGGNVRNRQTGTIAGNLNTAGGSTLKSWTLPVVGSVRYQNLVQTQTSNPVIQQTPHGDDLFWHTIRFDTGTCQKFNQNYAWQCPVGSIYTITPPAGTCNAGSVGNTSGSCCTEQTSNPFQDTRPNNWVWTSPLAAPPGINPNGSPPSLSGPKGETCNSIVYVDQQTASLGTNCVTSVIPCPGGGGELCTQVTCDTGVRHRWRCNYTESWTNPNNTCTAQAPLRCNATTNTCVDWGGAGVDTPARYIDGHWPAARYVVYDGPQPGTVAEKRDLSNYRMVMISRKFGWDTGTGTRDLVGTTLADAVSRWIVVDGATGLPSYRGDCDVLAGQDGTWCTFEQEAQNYANWYTYYRSRLFASIGVVSEVLSGFSGPEQYLRLGFARINHFKSARNPWNVQSVTDLLHVGGLPDLDGASNEGAVVRGVRSFTMFDPPLSGNVNTSRLEIFEHLFTTNSLGPTPNRETVHAIGRYYMRTDSKGPWGHAPGVGNEPPSEHLWCRRNYNLLATDGEWTKLPAVGGFEPQRLLERPSDWSVSPVAAGVTTSMSTTGSPITGTERLTDAPLTFTYVPGDEPQITGGSGTQTGTLTDVMHYYWSRDLRPDLRNSLNTSVNRAFWQHMANYVVGYGVQASMESPTLRPTFQARTLIAWPTVGLEPCRQFDNNARDASLPPPACTPAQHTVSPSGNRINDMLRGSLSGYGDFFAAQSPDQLGEALKAAIAAILAEGAAGSAPAFSSPSVSAGGLLVKSGFRTNVWDGYVYAFDTKEYIRHLAGEIAEPPRIWSATLPVHGDRNILTSKAQSTAVAFQWCNLSDDQRTLLDPVASATPCPTPTAPPIVGWLRGDQSREQPNGGFRRRSIVLGDIVNSAPVFSKAADHGYRFRPAASYKAGPPHGFAGYPDYVLQKKTTRAAVLMFGANDGMFHVLDARAGLASSGKEIFAYVPRAVYGKLRDLANPAYSHFYTVDGPLVESDVFVSNAWKTIVVGSTGAGPAGLFAIDVTAPQSGMGASNVLWDIVPADHASTDVQEHLGHVMGKGVIGSVKLDADSNPVTTPNGKWVFIVGNGYNSQNKEATLLIFDAMNGALIRAIKTPASYGGPAKPNGLGAVAPVYDGARNIVAAYAGDRQGNLWKFDLSADDPANWKVANEAAGSAAPLFEAGPTRPIHQEPRIAVHPLGGLYVAFGTGRLHEVSDAADTNDQGVYVLWDKADDNLAPISVDDLQLIRLQQYADGDEVYRRLHAGDLSSYDWTKRGFWIRLREHLGPADGERIIAPMIMDLGVLSVTSYSPTNGNDPCIPGGTSFLYRLDLAGGFKSGSFAGQGAATVGLQIRPGTAGAMPVFHIPADDGSAPVVDTMDAGQLSTMLQTPKYRITSGQAVNLGTLGTCQNVGLRVDGSFARIPIECAGMLPLRSWRPVR
jgi:type IV pilus assembly protein PilY1